MTRYLALFGALAVLCGDIKAHADQAYVVDGLEKPAEIIVDRWGVPHIYAQTHYDAFFVQGFNVARDRLWQIDLWRRRGLGELASVFGKTYVAQDRASRLFLYRGDMYREWISYASDTKRVLEAFTSGINAYIDLLDQHPDLLPPEFMLMNYRPVKWHASDVARIRSNALMRNLPSEVRRARIACEVGAEALQSWRIYEPDWPTTVPDGLDPCVIPANVLENYQLAWSSVTFPTPKDASSPMKEALPPGDAEGSNNWALAPSRTATGRAIMASDPHRSYAVPSLRYITHLAAPGLNVIGAGEPALPGITLGHNGRFAFGMTIFSIDQADLYVYEIRNGQYRYGDGWADFLSLQETIHVAGGKDETVTLKFTRHGPVIFENTTHAFAVRASVLEPGMAPYLSSLEYMRAKNWDEFVAALNRWGVPSLNHVYADVEGNIGHKVAGLFPHRKGWDGLLPVPGDGRYEWGGFHDIDTLPEVFNPDSGYIGTANEMNLPADFPIEKYPVGFDWLEPWRFMRLDQKLLEQSDHTLDHSVDLQHDYVSLFAVEMIRRLPASLTVPGAAILRQWDGNMTPDSGPAALFMLWLHRHLIPAVQSRLHAENPALFAGLDKRVLFDFVDQEDFHGTLTATLDAAFAEARNLMGDDPAQWAWGALHRTVFEHPLFARANGDMKSAMSVKSYPMGGHFDTLNNTYSFDTMFTVDLGASYRQVIDVGNWDASTMTNTPGQSGDPRSPFYDNLIEGWATGEQSPLLYSRDAIEKFQDHTITLSPANR